MALDGIMLGMIAEQIKQTALGAKIDKVQQPSRDELVLILRGPGCNCRLLISVRASYPRVNLTSHTMENPAQPPMLCMLLRKKLCGGRLVDIRQPGCERVIMLDFDCVNELYDHETLTLAVEIMGRCSNAVLFNEKGIVLDALKRVDITMSSQRIILPGAQYELPPAQDKLDARTVSADEIAARVLELEDRTLDKAVLSVVQGVSPIICREISYRVSGQTDARVCELTDAQREKVHYHIESLCAYARGEKCEPTLVCDLSGKPIDLAFMRVEQYSTGAVTRGFDDCSGMLDAFCYERDLSERMKVKSHDLLRTITAAADRTARKLAIQRRELEQARERDTLRLYGDLINANIYRLEKGSVTCELENCFSEDYEPVRIKLDPMLTPAQNAQAYYREYRRMQNAENHLVGLIEQGEREEEYLDSVLDALSRARSSAELADITTELAEQGYIRRQGSANKRQSALPPEKFMSDDGFEILVGRNNKQNDRLTLKEAAKNDIWLHVSKMPGSHVIVRQRDGVRPSDKAIEQGAIIAACRSSARDSGLVPVDFTEVRHVSKPQGAKPGMVIYTHQQTVYVKPDAQLAERLQS